MKSFIKYGLLTVAAVSMMPLTGCKDDEVYDTQVVREYNLLLNGEPWFNKTEDSHTYGKWNVYVYNNDGSFKGNYKTQYRFSLESGTYKIWAFYSPTVANVFECSTELDEVKIKQDSLMATEIACADVQTYKAGDPLNININTRTGLLRLRATDEKADKSYNMIRAKVTSPVKGYQPSINDVYTEDTNFEAVREKSTAGGGIGYAEDMHLFGSADYKVNIELEYYMQTTERDDEGNDVTVNTLVKSKSFDDGFVVLPNDTTTVTFQLNDPSEQVIINYNVEIGSTSWSDENQYPSVPVVVPDGYTYVKPDDDINAIYKELAADASVDEIKLFLKANAEYEIAAATVASVKKSVSILGQEPGYGQTLASLRFGGSISFSGNVDKVLLENLNIKGAQRFFGTARTDKFSVGELAVVDCELNDWTGWLLYQNTNSNNAQTFGTIRFENNRLINYTSQSTPFINLQNSATAGAPVDNIIFRGNVFHEKKFGATHNVLLGKLNNMKTPINILVEGNTFVATQAAGFTWFDINGAKSSSLNLTVKDNLVSGKTTGKGTWFKLGTVTSQSVSGNTRTAGYEMNWGVEAPAEVATTYSELLKQLNL